MKRLIYFLAAAMTACGTAPQAGLNVMTFNMRYDNPEDGENNWMYRRDRAAEVVTSHRIDVFGTQEVLSGQLHDLLDRLPGYEAVGVGREDGREQGEYCAVFYRTDRFTRVESGTFWLSETPEAAGSLGWDGACERTATWAVLRDRKSGAEFFFIDTHLDHVGEQARREGVSLLLRRIVAMSGGRPVILTGDFNAEPLSEVIAHVTRNGLLQDAKAIAAQVAGTPWSFSDFGAIPEGERPLIDYIFTGDRVAVDRYEVLPDTLNGGYVSDHAPVMAAIRFVKP